MTKILQNTVTFLLQYCVQWRWHGPALLQPGLPGGNKEPPGLDCLC